MSADGLQIMSYISFILAGICVIISIVLFFRFRVRYLIEKLSGKNEAVQVRQIRSSIGKASKQTAYRVFEQKNETAACTATEPLEEETVVLQETVKDFVLLQDEIEIHTKEKI